MKTVLTASPRLYRKLLTLYPASIRREFGDEMCLVFTEDLEDAWQRRQFAGIARVWWQSLYEFFCVAPTAHWANPYVAVPSLAFGFSAVWNFCIFCMALRRALPAGVTVASAAVAILLGPGIATALTALIVVGLSRRGMMTSLNLTRRVSEYTGS